MIDLLQLTDRELLLLTANRMESLHRKMDAIMVEIGFLRETTDPETGQLSCEKMCAMIVEELPSYLDQS